MSASTRFVGSGPMIESKSKVVATGLWKAIPEVIVENEKMKEAERLRLEE